VIAEVSFTEWTGDASIRHRYSTAAQRQDRSDNDEQAAAEGRNRRKREKEAKGKRSSAEDPADESAAFLHEAGGGDGSESGELAGIKVRTPTAS